jgi:hypothetical protein
MKQVHRDINILFDFGKKMTVSPRIHFGVTVIFHFFLFVSLFQLCHAPVDAGKYAKLQQET